MDSALATQLARTLDMTEELAENLDDQAMSRRFREPSNTIWEQFWCIVGARESHARAFAAGEWVGFDCSLTADDRDSQRRVVEALRQSRGELERAVSLPGRHEDMVLDLLLHETQHQGQLIRYVYGLGLEFPQSWRERWNL